MRIILCEFCTFCCSFLSVSRHHSSLRLLFLFLRMYAGEFMGSERYDRLWGVVQADDIAVG